MGNALITLAVTGVGIAIASATYLVVSAARSEFRLWRRRRALVGEALIARIRRQFDGLRSPLRMVGKR